MHQEPPRESPHRMHPRESPYRTYQMFLMFYQILLSPQVTQKIQYQIILIKTKKTFYIQSRSKLCALLTIQYQIILIKTKKTFYIGQ